MYTTPLSTLISSCSLNHHLYADDTELFLSFLPTHFDSSIDHLRNALDRISSWITANLLTLNSSKTEFLFIGLSKQLAKINNSSLTTTHSVETLAASYLMNTLLFLTRSHLCPNLAITIFVTWFTESPSIVRCACRLARKPSVDVVRTSSASLSYSSFTSSLKNCSSSSDRRNATRSSSEIYRPRTYSV